MGLAKTIARKILFPTITSLGLEKIFSMIPKNKALVIMFHGVAPEIDPNLNGRHMQAKQFETLLCYLKNTFNVVSFVDLMENKNNGQVFNKKTIAITFDDGFENNYNCAFPILQKLSLPATFFVLTGGLENESFVNWPDTFELIHRYTSVPSIELNGITFDRKGKMFFSKDLQCKESDYFKGLGEERYDMLEALKTAVEFEKILQKAPKSTWKLMTKSQIRDMSKSGIIEIGSHTHMHHNLGLIQHELAYKEMERSKKLLEDIIEQPVHSIAFPDGSYTNSVKKQALACGYKYLAAVTSHEEDDRIDKTIITRLGLSNTTTPDSNIIQIHLAFN